MRIGFIGLGKLGLPVALAIEAAGHEVRGYDPSDGVVDILDSKLLPYKEEGAQALLSRSTIDMVHPWNLSKWAEIIFVAVQTPHGREYEGVTRLPQTRADFDYSYLREAVASLHSSAPLVVVISTVLPGTMEREIIPIVGRERLLYNPFFIAMGTAIPDFRAPEFVLVGSDHAHVEPLARFYETIHARRLFLTTIRTAELTKVAYNTFIGLKIVFANTMMELCEKTGADVNDLVDALSLADQRLLSPAYLRGGMGDGGGCHPRDNIALSWLAREVGLSYDLFEAMMECRERQTEWIAEQVSESGLPVTILGKAYKPESALSVGAPATLLSNLLREQGIEHEQSDPFV